MSGTPEAPSGNEAAKKATVTEAAPAAARSPEPAAARGSDPIATLVASGPGPEGVSAGTPGTEASAITTPVTNAPDLDSVLRTREFVPDDMVNLEGPESTGPQEVAEAVAQAAHRDRAGADSAATAPSESVSNEQTDSQTEGGGGIFGSITRFAKRTARFGLKGKRTGPGGADAMTEPEPSASAVSTEASRTVAETNEATSTGIFDGSDVFSEPISQQAPAEIPSDQSPQSPSAESSPSAKKTIVIGTKLSSTEAQAREAGGFGASGNRAYENARFAEQRKRRRDDRTDKYHIDKDASFLSRKAKIAVGGIKELPHAFRERGEATATDAEAQDKQQIREIAAQYAMMSWKGTRRSSAERQSVKREAVLEMAAGGRALPDSLRIALDKANQAQKTQETTTREAGVLLRAGSRSKDIVKNLARAATLQISELDKSRAQLLGEARTLIETGKYKEGVGLYGQELMDEVVAYRLGAMDAVVTVEQSVPREAVGEIAASAAAIRVEDEDHTAELGVLLAPGIQRKAEALMAARIVDTTGASADASGKTDPDNQHQTPQTAFDRELEIMELADNLQNSAVGQHILRQHPKLDSFRLATILYGAQDTLAAGVVDATDVLSTSGGTIIEGMQEVLGGSAYQLQIEEAGPQDVAGIEVKHAGEVAQMIGMFEEALASGNMTYAEAVQAAMKRRLGKAAKALGQDVAEYAAKSMPTSFAKKLLSRGAIALAVTAGAGGWIAAPVTAVVAAGFGYGRGRIIGERRGRISAVEDIARAQEAQLRGGTYSTTPEANKVAKIQNRRKRGRAAEKLVEERAEQAGKKAGKLGALFGVGFGLGFADLEHVAIHDAAAVLTDNHGSRTPIAPGTTQEQSQLEGYSQPHPSPTGEVQPAADISGGPGDTYPGAGGVAEQVVATRDGGPGDTYPVVAAANLNGGPGDAYPVVGNEIGAAGGAATVIPNVGIPPGGGGDYFDQFHGGQDALAFLAEKQHAGTQPLPSEEIVVGQGQNGIRILLGEATYDNKSGNIVDGSTTINKQQVIQYEHLFSNLHVNVNGTPSSNYTVEYNPDNGGGFNLVVNGEVAVQDIQLKGNQLTIGEVNGSFDAQHLTLNLAEPKSATLDLQDKVTPATPDITDPSTFTAPSGREFYFGSTKFDSHNGLVGQDGASVESVSQLDADIAVLEKMQFIDSHKLAVDDNKIAFVFDAKTKSWDVYDSAGKIANVQVDLTANGGKGGIVYDQSLGSMSADNTGNLTFTQNELSPKTYTVTLDEKTIVPAMVVEPKEIVFTSNDNTELTVAGVTLNQEGDVISSDNPNQVIFKAAEASRLQTILPLNKLPSGSQYALQYFSGNNSWEVLKNGSAVKGLDDFTLNGNGEVVAGGKTGTIVVSGDNLEFQPKAVPGELPPLTPDQIQTILSQESAVIGGVGGPNEIRISGLINAPDGGLMLPNGTHDVLNPAQTEAFGTFIGHIEFQTQEGSKTVQVHPVFYFDQSTKSINAIDPHTGMAIFENAQLMLTEDGKIDPQFVWNGNKVTPNVDWNHGNITFTMQEFTGSAQRQDEPLVSLIQEAQEKALQHVEFVGPKGRVIHPDISVDSHGQVLVTDSMPPHRTLIEGLTFDFSSGNLVARWKGPNYQLSVNPTTHEPVITIPDEVPDSQVTNQSIDLATLAHDLTPARPPKGSDTVGNQLGAETVPTGQLLTTEDGGQVMLVGKNNIPVLLGQAKFDSATDTLQLGNAQTFSQEQLTQYEQLFNQLHITGVPKGAQISYAYDVHGGEGAFNVLVNGQVVARDLRLEGTGNNVNVTFAELNGKFDPNNLTLHVNQPSAGQEALPTNYQPSALPEISQDVASFKTQSGREFNFGTDNHFANGELVNKDGVTVVEDGAHFKDDIAVLSKMQFNNADDSPISDNQLSFVYDANSHTWNVFDGTEKIANVHVEPGANDTGGTIVFDQSLGTLRTSGGTYIFEQNPFQNPATQQNPYTIHLNDQAPVTAVVVEPNEIIFTSNDKTELTMSGVTLDDKGDLVSSGTPHTILATGSQISSIQGILPTLPAGTNVELHFDKVDSTGTYWDIKLNGKTVLKNVELTKQGQIEVKGAVGTIKYENGTLEFVTSQHQPGTQQTPPPVEQNPPATETTMENSQQFLKQYNYEPDTLKWVDGAQEQQLHTVLTNNGHTLRIISEGGGHNVKVMAFEIDGKDGRPKSKIYVDVKYDAKGQAYVDVPLDNQSDVIGDSYSVLGHSQPISAVSLQSYFNVTGIHKYVNTLPPGTLHNGNGDIALNFYKSGPNDVNASSVSAADVTHVDGKTVVTYREAIVGKGSMPKQVEVSTTSGAQGQPGTQVPPAGESGGQGQTQQSPIEGLTATSQGLVGEVNGQQVTVIPEADLAKFNTIMSQIQFKTTDGRTIQPTIEYQNGEFVFLDPDSNANPSTPANTPILVDGQFQFQSNGDLVFTETGQIVSHSLGQDGTLTFVVDENGQLQDGNFDLTQLLKPSGAAEQGSTVEIPTGVNEIITFNPVTNQPRIFDLGTATLQPDGSLKDQASTFTMDATTLLHNEEILSQIQVVDKGQPVPVKVVYAGNGEFNLVTETGNTPVVVGLQLHGNELSWTNEFGSFSKDGKTFTMNDSNTPSPAGRIDVSGFSTAPETVIDVAPKEIVATLPDGQQIVFGDVTIQPDGKVVGPNGQPIPGIPDIASLNTILGKLPGELPSKTDNYEFDFQSGTTWKYGSVGHAQTPVYVNSNGTISTTKGGSAGTGLPSPETPPAGGGGQSGETITGGTQIPTSVMEASTDNNGVHDIELPPNLVHTGNIVYDTSTKPPTQVYLWSDLQRDMQTLANIKYPKGVKPDDIIYAYNDKSRNWIGYDGKGNEIFQATFDPTTGKPTVYGFEHQADNWDWKDISTSQHPLEYEFVPKHGGALAFATASAASEAIVATGGVLGAAYGASLPTEPLTPYTNGRLLRRTRRFLNRPVIQRIRRALGYGAVGAGVAAVLGAGGAAATAAEAAGGLGLVTGAARRVDRTRFGGATGRRIWAERLRRGARQAAGAGLLGNAAEAGFGGHAVLHGTVAATQEAVGARGVGRVPGVDRLARAERADYRIFNAEVPTTRAAAEAILRGDHIVVPGGNPADPIPAATPEADVIAAAVAQQRIAAERLLSRYGVSGQDALTPERVFALARGIHRDTIGVTNSSYRNVRRTSTGQLRSLLPRLGLSRAERRVFRRVWNGQDNFIDSHINHDPAHYDPDHPNVGRVLKAPNIHGVELERGAANRIVTLLRSNPALAGGVAAATPEAQLAQDIRNYDGLGATDATRLDANERLFTFLTGGELPPLAPIAPAAVVI